MPDLQAHRLVNPISEPRCVRFTPPFSCFDYVFERFAGLTSLHRCFSLARSFEAQAFVEEHIPPAGIIEQENDEIAALGLTQGRHNLLRLSFWNCPVKTTDDFRSRNDANLIGYVILKEDTGVWEGRRFSQWHVFEAVFRKYAHPHNCLPNLGHYQVRVAGKTFTVRGVLYCQQNGLNKACAHVALRSLLSRLLPDRDVSYSTLNAIAQRIPGSSGIYRPSAGLSVQQIRTILEHLNIPFRDMDYDEESKKDSKIRERHLFTKYLYSGIESGVGGLLGFSMSGPQATQARHIIPFYGHTFNKDTWTPDAEVFYFNIGANVGYIPSESWTSSFLGHDDNFGPNFCVPRLYVKPENVHYAVELLQEGAQYNGMVAEVIALRLLYSLLPHLDTGNTWQRHLAQYVRKQQIILRVFCTQNMHYLYHLRRIRDWKGNAEKEVMLEALNTYLPPLLWVIEFSIPQLFPANERKLGEIILNAGCSPKDIFAPFIIARLPGNYLVLTDQEEKSYEQVASGLQSHVELMQQNERSPS